MAVDGTTSPAHHLSPEMNVSTTAVKTSHDNNATSSDDRSRDASSPDDGPAQPSNDVDVKPTAPRSDRHPAVENGRALSRMTSPLPADNGGGGSGGGGYYFGESHVTRLESFVESLTGPSHPSSSSSSAHDPHQRWSTLREWPNGAAAATVPAYGTQAPQHKSSSRPDRFDVVTGGGGTSTGYNQPLDLSVKPHPPRSGGDSVAIGRCAKPNNFVGKCSSDGGGMTSPLALMNATAAGALLPNIVGAGYPTIADMWLAHWLNMASAASSLLPHLQQLQQLGGQLQQQQQPLLTGPLGLHLSPDCRNNKISTQSSKMAASPLSSSSSMTSCPTPTNSASDARSPRSATNDADSQNHHRRRLLRDVTVTSSHQQQPASAFSLFHRDAVDGKKEPGGLSSSNGGGSVLAALSAIESFVENSFSPARNGRTASSAVSRCDSKPPLLRDPMPSRRDGLINAPSTASSHHRAALKRLHHDEHAMTSSGDEESLPRDCERRSATGRDIVKRRRHRQLREGPEVDRLHREDETIEQQQQQLDKKTPVKTEPIGTDRPEAETGVGNSSLEYLHCLAYDRPIDSQHPLECLERLVHVHQSSTTPGRRSAPHVMTSQRAAASPSMTSSLHRAVATPPAAACSASRWVGAERPETSGSGDEHVTCSSSNNDDDAVRASTPKEDDDVTSAGALGAADAFRSPTTASLVCCNM